VAGPLRIGYPGVFYRVMSRRNERKEVFWSGKDREQSLSDLESATSRYGQACVSRRMMRVGALPVGDILLSPFLRYPAKQG
jgi:hypothetical protein